MPGQKDWASNPSLERTWSDNYLENTIKIMKVVDLFCGCGGLSLGFEKAGMDVVAAFDNWPEALDVYRQNFSHPAFRADLTNVEESVKRIRQFEPDMIIGKEKNTRTRQLSFLNSLDQVCRQP